MAPNTSDLTLVEISAKLALDNQDLFANYPERLKFEDYFKGLVTMFAGIRVKTERNGESKLEPEVEALRTIFLDDVKGSDIVKKYDAKATAAGSPDLVEVAKAEAAGMDLDFLGWQIDRMEELGLF